MSDPVAESKISNEETPNTIHEELVEQSAAEPIEADLAQEQNDVTNLVHKMQSEMALVQDRYLRLAAEFENFKKRTEREHLTSLRFASEGILRELLPVLDNLEQALLAAENTQQTEDPNNKTMITGLKMVLKHFQDTLGRFGIQSFSAKGQLFDPLKHEAVMEREDADAPRGQVLEEFQKGYMLHDRLVRPARVVVAKTANV